jgi:hypothetical protein
MEIFAIGKLYEGRIRRQIPASSAACQNAHPSPRDGVRLPRRPTAFGTRGLQVQILPLRPTLSLDGIFKPDSFPDRNDCTKWTPVGHAPCLITVWLEVRVLPDPPRSPMRTGISQSLKNSPQSAGIFAVQIARVRSLSLAEVAIRVDWAFGLWAIQTRSWRRPGCALTPS